MKTNRTLSCLEGKKKLLNKQCHAELVSASSIQAVSPRQQQASKTLKQVQDDVINNNAASGFTLIELLVVVLIIGILASVALPQYTKAVEKARAAEIISNVNALTKSAEMYLLSGNTDTILMSVDLSAACEYDFSTIGRPLLRTLRLREE